jgi:hypothetical protein
MEENPYEAPAGPSEPGRRFPYKRIFWCSVTCTLVSGAIWYPVMQFATGRNLVVMITWVGSFAALNVGLLTMAVSFIGWRMQSRSVRQAPTSHESGL